MPDSYPELGGNGYEVMNDVVPTPDGGAVAAGYAIHPGGYSSWGMKQAFAVRFDALGGELWRTHLGEPTGEGVEALRIRRTPDGGFVLACSAWTPSGPDSPGTYYEISFVSKLDASGAEQWRFRVDPLDMDAIGDLDVAPDGSIVAAGRVWRKDGSTSTAVLKLSPAGSLAWIRKGAPDQIGFVSRVAAAPDGGFYACSVAGLSLTLARYAADGSFLWSSRLEGLDGELYGNEKFASGLTATSDGGCAVVGGTRESTLASYGAFRPFLAGFDAYGRQTATVVVPTTSSWVHAVVRLSDGGILAAEGVGGSDTGPVFVRYDGRGNELWRSVFGQIPRTRYLQAIRETADGGIVAAGCIDVQDRYASMDGYVLMLGGNGTAGGGDIGARIDLLPGNDGNPVNYRSNGVLPVALLSSPGFDAPSADIASIRLEGAPVARDGRGRFQVVRKDVDRDGRDDLLLLFSVPALGLKPSSTAVTLRGTVPGAGSFSASDAVRIVGMPASSEAAKPRNESRGGGQAKKPSGR